MTDQRYDGSDGAKRLELLEELVAAVARWSADGHDRRLPGVLDAFNTIVDWDNERLEECEDATPSDDDDSRWRQ